MARVRVLREVRSGDATDWHLCFQWCLYLYDEGEPQYGYRFVWRRPESEGGSLQAARGQARIPSIIRAQELLERATEEGWGDRDGDQMEIVTERLRGEGCIVDFASGYVGWPTKEAAERGRLTEGIVADEQLVRNWSH